MVTAMHVFDLDGTLLPATTGSLELAKVMGHLDALHGLESRFASGELDTRGFAGAIHELGAELSSEQVSSAFASAPRLSRIADIFADNSARH